jgi:hypothetical protein
MVLNITLSDALPSVSVSVAYTPTPTATSSLRGSTASATTTPIASVSTTPSATSTPSLTPSLSASTTPLPSMFVLPASFVQLMNVFESVYTNTFSNPVQYDRFVELSDELSVYLYLSYASGKQTNNLPADQQLSSENLCSRAMSIRTRVGKPMTTSCNAYTLLMSQFSDVYASTINTNSLESYDRFVADNIKSATVVHVNMFLVYVYALQTNTPYAAFSTSTFMLEAKRLAESMQTPTVTPT